jgi:hypothetical protein
MIKKNVMIIFLLVVLAVILVMGVGWWWYLRQAHSMFENYYTFRGCAKLVERTADYGICQTKDGQTIKIVKYQDRWYLDGDLPWACVGVICLGI